MHMADSHVAVKDDYELINVQNFGIKEKKEKKAQQKGHKNRNGRLWGVIKTPNVVKIAEDTTKDGKGS